MSQIPTFLLIKLLRERNQIWCTCNSPTFGNIRVICYTKKFFLAGDGRWSFWYVKVPIWRQNFVFLKDKGAWWGSVQTAWSKRPFYTMKMPFLLPWLQNRLQTISSKNFSVLKKKFRMKFFNSYDLRNSLRPKNEDSIFFLIVP